MKYFAKASLFAAVMLAALNRASGAEAQRGPCDDDALGMGGCDDKSTAPSSSKEGDVADKMPQTYKIPSRVVYDTVTYLDVHEDMVFFSDETIDSMNLHFTVHAGATLTLRAPTINIKRDEASVSPLFELSGALRLEAVGSAPALLDGNLADEGGIIQVLDDNAVFMSGRDNVVRYHASGITVSKMGETDDLDGPHHKEVELSPLLQNSLADTHAKLNAKSEVPSSTFSSSPSTSSSSFSRSTSSSSSSATPLSTSPTSTSDDVDNEIDSDVCAATPYFGTLDGRDYCPSPTISTVDTATTTTSAGGDKGETHATASADCDGDTSTSTNSGTRFDGNSNNGGKGTDDDDDHTHNNGSNNRGPEPQQTPSTTPPPTPATDDMKPSVWSPKRVLTVADKLIAEPLVALTDLSAIWVAKHGDTIFAKDTANPSDVSSHKTSEGVDMSVLVAADIGKLKRVVRSRQELIQELEGDMPANENRRRSVWGWVPFRSQLQKDIETVREHFGEVEMTLSDRACVEVSVDGICVLAKSGPYKREWMNRFPWRWSKNNDYQLHVTDDGMEVRLGERRVWGVAVDERRG